MTKLKLTLVVSALLTAVACTPTVPTEPGPELRWFDDVPQGTPTLLARFDEPIDAVSGVAPLGDGRLVYGVGNTLEIDDGGEKQTLGPWSGDFDDFTNFSTPLLIDGVLLARDVNGHLIAVDPSDGTMLWRDSWAGWPWKMGDRVAYCDPTDATGCLIQARDVRTGEVLWEDPNPGGLISTSSTEDGLCVVGPEGVRLIGIDGVQRFGLPLLGPIGEGEFGPEGTHQCVPTPWGAVVSYSGPMGSADSTTRVVGLDLGGAERWTVEIPFSDVEDFSSLWAYLDGVLVQTGSGVRRLDAQGIEVWGPEEFPIAGVQDVAANGDILVAPLQGHYLVAVSEDLSPWMGLSLGPTNATIYIDFARLDGDTVLTTADRRGVLDQDRWGEILLWE